MMLCCQYLSESPKMNIYCFSYRRITRRQVMRHILWISKDHAKTTIQTSILDVDSSPAGLGMDIIACIRPALSTSKRISRGPIGFDQEV